MPATDWQRVRLNASLALLKASRLKDLQDGQIARLRGQVAGLASDRFPFIARLLEAPEIPRLQAKREDAIKQIEAAAAALGQLVTEEIEEPANGKHHPGGRLPKYDWDLIWALTARDLLEDALPQTIAELVGRIQAACRKEGIAEPDEETLRQKARVWFYTLWRGEPPLRARGKVVTLR